MSVTSLCRRVLGRSCSGTVSYACPRRLLSTHAATKEVSEPAGLLSPADMDMKATASSKLDTLDQGDGISSNESEAARIRSPASTRTKEKKQEKFKAPGPGYGTGRRKSSVARVWVKPGDGLITINDRSLHEYFGRTQYREKVIAPFVATHTIGEVDVWCTVKGGGTTGQAGAICLGISRALKAWRPNLRTLLRQESLLTRDPRRVERQKPGQPKARKKDQWVKR